MWVLRVWLFRFAHVLVYANVKISCVCIIILHPFISTFYFRNYETEDFLIFLLKALSRLNLKQKITDIMVFVGFVEKIKKKKTGQNRKRISHERVGSHARLDGLSPISIFLFCSFSAELYRTKFQFFGSIIYFWVSRALEIFLILPLKISPYFVQAEFARLVL